MNELVNFKKIIDKKDLYIYFVFSGKNIHHINPNDIYPLLDELEDTINKDVTYDELLTIFRTILKSFVEDDLILNYSKKNLEYNSKYKNKVLVEYVVNKQIGNSMNIRYDYSDGICNYSITTNEKKSNLDLFNYLVDEVPTKIKTIKKANQ